MNKKQIRHEIIVRMPEPFIKLLIDTDCLSNYIEGMERHIMFRQMYNNHPFDVIKYLTSEMQWDFEYHLAALNADPSKYKSITIKKVNRSKCRYNYWKLSTLRHYLIAELMPYRLIHFLIENKVFEEYIKIFIWQYCIFIDPIKTFPFLKISLNSGKAIVCAINNDYFRYNSSKFTYHEWIKLSEKYKEYFINSL